MIFLMIFAVKNDIIITKKKGALGK